MGACTSKKSQQVVPGAITKTDINQSAHDHLKNMINEDPLAASMSSSALNNTLKKIAKPGKEGEEAKVVDKDSAFF